MWNLQMAARTKWHLEGGCAAQHQSNDRPSGIAQVLVAARGMVWGQTCRTLFRVNGYSFDQWTHFAEA